MDFLYFFPFPAHIFTQSTVSLFPLAAERRLAINQLTGIITLPYFPKLYGEKWSNIMKNSTRFFLVLALLLCLLPISALADDTVPISTADELMALLETTPATAPSTRGKTYVLQNDITIDTSGLAVSYPTSTHNIARQFSGTLDGGGHTITVLDSGDKPSQPIFDSLTGENANPAQVKNLNLHFQGNVSGTTVATHLSYVSMEHVDVTFDKDILFAATSDGYALATGVFGRTSNGIDVLLEDVSVTATGNAPYGVIGEATAKDQRYVMAAGIYSEWTAAGGEVILDGVEVNVAEICAVSSYQAENPYATGICCSAGVSSGYNQSNLRLGNATVTVAGNISATTVDGSNAGASAYGLGYHLLAMYQCQVNVGGNIQAITTEAAVHTAYAQDMDICAAGMGYEVQPKYNQQVFGATDTGLCSVTVGGDILAVATSELANPSNYSTSALVCGIAYNTSQEVSWRNVSVEASSIRAEAAAECSAYAAGFTYQPYHSGNNTGDAFDYDGCTVTAEEISAIAQEGGGYVGGFMFWGYGTYQTCAVEVDLLESRGLEAATAGFVYRFSPNTSLWRTELYGEMKACSVTAERIIATSTDPSYTAEVAGLVGQMRYAVNGISAAIRDCTVTVNEALQAQGGDAMLGLLGGSNEDAYSLFDNTVTLPRDQAAVTTLEGVDYVPFTALELTGRGGETAEATAAWESGNRVILLRDSENDVFCRFDEGDADGTLWQLTKTAELPDGYTLHHEVNGGIPIPSETRDAPWRRHVDDLPTPIRSGYSFAGWYLDEQLTIPVEEHVHVNQESVTIYAKWNRAADKPSSSAASQSKVCEHLDYLHGYGNGRFGPDDAMTRAQAAQMFDNLLLGQEISGDVTFLDVPADAWYAQAVSRLAALGVIEGVGNGRFAPERAISRAEFTAMAMRFAQVTGGGTCTFSDVLPGAWYYEAVAGAAELGWIDGYPDGTFRPNATISRAEVAAIVNRMLGRVADQDYIDSHSSEIRTFRDLPTTHWAYYHIAEAVHHHTYTPADIREQWIQIIS